MSKTPLEQLSDLGPSVWIDYLSRDLLESGELERMTREDAVVGVTSNPTIFQKAMAAGDAYDDQMREVLERESDAKEVFLAIAVSIARGMPINVTLIFSLERHRKVAEAYLRGLERLVADGGDPSAVASVASFFVSRVDTEADKRLDAVGRADLKGKLAVANAKLAYQNYEQVFSGSRWEAL